MPADLLAALPALAVRALLESALVGALLAGALWLAVERLVPLRAAARHTLWSLALCAIAILPLASIGSSLAHVTRIPLAGEISRPRGAAIAVPLATAAKSAPSVANGTQRTGITQHRSTPIAFPSLTIPQSIALLALGIWALGAAIGFALLAASIWRVQGLKRRSSPLDGALAGELGWLTDPHDREIYLRLSYEIETPVAIGFGRPVILIPTELATNEGLGAIEGLVMHEHAHLRRYDDYTNLLQRTIERLFWFNPIVWIVGKRIALEREIASDDCVVAQTGHAQEYAESLWRLAKEMRMPEHAIVAPGALLTRKQITVRIEQLLDAKRDLRARLSPAAIATLAVGSAVALVTMTASAPAIELHEPALAAATAPIATSIPRTIPRAQAPKLATAAAPAFVTGDSKRVIFLQELPAAPNAQNGSLPAPATTPLTAAQREALQHIRNVAETANASRTMEKAVNAAQRAAERLAERAARAAEIDASDAPNVPKIHIEIPRIPARAFRPHPSIPEGPVPPQLLSSCAGCDLHGRNLAGIDLRGKLITGINLRGANLSGAQLQGATLSGVDLSGANLDGADLRLTHLIGTNFSDVSLRNADLAGIKLEGTSLAHIGLTGREDVLSDLLSQCTGCILRNMNLHGADLRSLTLTGADARGVDLSEARLAGAHFAGVDFHGANFTGADLRGTEFTGCDLRGVTFGGADTRGATFTGSTISTSP